MITLQMTLVPYGSRLHQEAPLITATLYTIPGKGARHGYRILDNQGQTLAEGDVPKTRSGHQNPLHLLRDVLATIDFDALGTDYVRTPYDKER